MTVADSQKDPDHPAESWQGEGDIASLPQASGLCSAPATPILGTESTEPADPFYAGVPVRAQGPWERAGRAWGRGRQDIYSSSLKETSKCGQVGFYRDDLELL